MSTANALELLRKRREASDLRKKATTIAAARTVSAAETADPAPCPVCGNAVFWVDPFDRPHCGNCRRPPAESMVRGRVVVIHTPAGLAWERLDGQEAPQPPVEAGPPHGVSYEAWWASLPEIDSLLPTPPPETKCPRCGGKEFDRDPKSPTLWCVHCYPPSARSIKKTPRRKPNARKR